MNTALALIARIWHAVPAGLRRFVGTGIAAGIAMLIVMTGWLFWGTGYIQERLGIPTRTDVEAVADAVTIASEDQVLAVARIVSEQTIRRYDDSLRTEAERLSREVAEPLVGTVEQLIRRVAAIEGQIGATNRKLDDLPRQTGHAAARITESMDALRRELEAAEIRENMLRLQRQLDSIQRTPPTPARTSRVRM